MTMTKFSRINKQHAEVHQGPRRQRERRLGTLP